MPVSNLVCMPKLGSLTTMRHTLRQASLAPLLLLWGLGALAAPSASTLQACADMDAALPSDQVIHSTMSIQYHLQTAKYWSTALRDVDPACIVLPTSAAQVSSAVQVLNRYPDVEFAVKSGGHDPNVGHATVQDGVLVAFHDLVGATYDAEANLAHVKPGGEWNDVIGDLEPSGVTIVGGRLGLVGVGGYLLQGGISFLSAQYGLAADVRKLRSLLSILGFHDELIHRYYRTL